MLSLWLCYLCVLGVLLTSELKYGVKAALSDDADMLYYAARDGDLDKVLDFVKNKRVSLTTRNNYGVR